MLIIMDCKEGYQMECYGQETYRGSLNCRADEMAKQYQLSQTGPLPHTISIKNEGWSIWIDNVKQELFD